MLMTQNKHPQSAVVNFPPRRWLQRCDKVPTLRQGGRLEAGAHTAQNGCGAGYGTRLAVGSATDLRAALGAVDGTDDAVIASATVHDSTLLPRKAAAKVRRGGD